ncbi:MAG: hypothetical protein HY764_00150 [Candidatus Portnoybacteria bacterium]|nr:hypothetical protein [Candidatus Portnoybacteria bacterium]
MKNLSLTLIILGILFLIYGLNIKSADAVSDLGFLDSLEDSLDKIESRVNDRNRFIRQIERTPERIERKKQQEINKIEREIQREPRKILNAIRSEQRKLERKLGEPERKLRRIERRTESLEKQMIRIANKIERN